MIKHGRFEIRGTDIYENGKYLQTGTDVADALGIVDSIMEAEANEASLGDDWW